MHQRLVWPLLLLFTIVLSAQERTLPTDFRQHNLTQFNASFLNPTYALDWNLPNSLAVWTRWQWQSIDGDPTTLFVNYTQKINPNAAAGVGFLQHNTGTYLNTGLNLNYVHAFTLENNIKIFVGANIFGFREKLADDRFVPDPNIDLPELENTEDFVLIFSPAARLQVDQFNLGLALENVADINLTDSSRGAGDGGTSVLGTLSYDVPVVLFNGVGQSFVRPLVYVKSIPNGDTQVGLAGLLSTSKFWVQGGYNSFYGASGGLGVTFARQFSIGGLVEIGLDDVLRDEKSTLELVVSYHVGTTDNRKKVVGFDVEKDDALAYARMQAEEEARQLEEDKKKRQQAEMEAEEQIRLQEQQRRDSIAAAALAQAKALAEQRKKDSIARVQSQKVELLPNERYEEVASAEGLEPGFYLIANVFGTKKYYESFMMLLKKRGLNPKSFYRSQNKFNYVYLERYDTMQEARKARDSKFGGKYTNKTWIFRVRRN
nr:PorP/SprF family type IX secretion system membrane protein [Allomuricauda sp.]